MSRNNMPQPGLPFGMSVNQFTICLFVSVLSGCGTAIGLAFCLGWIK